jgi:hypothetical protein
MPGALDLLEGVSGVAEPDHKARNRGIAPFFEKCGGTLMEAGQACQRRVPEKGIT